MYGHFSKKQYLEVEKHKEMMKIKEMYQSCTTNERRECC
jgi:hypothetical protein